MKADLAKIIGAGESESVEFKGPKTPLESLGKVVCGMLNQAGGVLVWGVTENKENKIVGLEESPAKEQMLNHFLMRHLSPRPFISISKAEIKDKQVIVVEVPRGSDKPYFFNREIWVRIGESIFKADSQRSSRMVQEQALEFNRWERAPAPGFELSDCESEELIRSRTEIIEAGRFGIDVPKDEETFLDRLYLRKNGQLTNGALVLFARHPKKWASNLGVRILSYRNDRPDSITGETEFVDMPAIPTLRSVVTLLQQRTGYSVRFDRKRLEREDRPGYPLYALREALVNAIVHRDYSVIRAGVRIEIYPDRIVIQNPGSLPDNWKVKDLLSKHESRPKNPDIARVFYLRRFMDQLGQGTQRIVEEMTGLGAKRPHWEAKQGVVSVTLYRAPDAPLDAQLQTRQLEFLAGIQPTHRFRPTVYAKKVGVSDRQARRDLGRMQALGLIAQLGRGPSTVYVRTQKALNP